MTDLTHADSTGAARMVDVSQKSESHRRAIASGSIRMRMETFNAIRRNDLDKGDVIAVARVAGIQAAKQTSNLVPLCHNIPLADVRIDVTADENLPGFRVEAAVATIARTGVEMEAIVAVSVTLITVYDMAKSNDRGMVISEIRLVEKEGGRSGLWRA